jgi:hypothetical protein
VLDGDLAEIREKGTGDLIVSASHNAGLYTLNLASPTSNPLVSNIPCLTAQAGEAALTSTLWHRRAGHLPEPALKNMAKLTEGMEVKELKDHGKVLHPCVACIEGKSGELSRFVQIQQNSNRQET